MGEDEEKHKLALFTSEQKAHQYEMSARLKSFSAFCSSTQHEKQYRKNSLLGHYCRGYVEEYIEGSLITDPEI